MTPTDAALASARLALRALYRDDVEAEKRETFAPRLMKRIDVLEREHAMECRELGPCDDCIGEMTPDWNGEP